MEFAVSTRLYLFLYKETDGQSHIPKVSYMFINIDIVDIFVWVYGRIYVFGIPTTISRRLFKTNTYILENISAFLLPKIKYTCKSFRRTTHLYETKANIQKMNKNINFKSTFDLKII